MRDEEAPPAARAAAAIAILDRAWGRPAQMIVSAHLGPRSARELSEDELLGIIEQGKMASLPALLSTPGEKCIGAPERLSLSSRGIDVTEELLVVG
jgi:hypothetical protein